LEMPEHRVSSVFLLAYHGRGLIAVLATTKRSVLLVRRIKRIISA
jgi:hypothetical protein